jgi:hypothetical protein
VAIALVAAAAACLVGGRVRESAGSRLSAVEAAVLAGGVTGAIALVIAGLVVLTGGPTAVVIVAVLAVAGSLEGAVRFRGRRRARPAPRPASGPAPAGGHRPPVWGAPMVGMAPVLRPVRSLSTESLGREWLLSTSVLGSLVDVGTRQSIVRRRQELLDELERRDPAGFARWLAGGPRPGSDPATYLHGDPAADKDAA